MNRQQRRQQERAEKKIQSMGDTLRRMNPLAEDVYQRGYRAGLEASAEFVIKDCYAAAVLALHDLEGYGSKRSIRFLKAMDSYIVNRLDAEELMDDVLQRTGVRFDFRQPFTEDRIQEVCE